MEKTDKNLSDLYMEKYIVGAPTVTEQQATVVTESDDKKEKDKKEKDKKKKTKGEWTPDMYNDSTQFSSIFGDIIKTFNEDFEGAADIGDGVGDDTMGFDDEGEDEQITVSKASLQAVIDQLQALIGDLDGEYVGDEGEDDVNDIPLESYGFDGAGAHVGAQADYSGKAGLLPKTDLVDANGNIKKDKVKVGGKPTKGHNGEGAHKGAQDKRDGKAGKQSPSNLVKGNGDADFGKNKTGFGRGKGEDLF